MTLVPKHMPKFGWAKNLGFVRFDNTENGKMLFKQMLLKAYYDQSLVKVHATTIGLLQRPIAFSRPEQDRLRITIGAVVDHNHLTSKENEWYIIPKEWRDEADATVKIALRRAIDQHAVAQGLSVFEVLERVVATMNHRFRPENC